MLEKLRNKKGFTFVEAILATVLLSVGLWGGLAMFQAATANSSANDARVIAGNLASEKMEQIIADKRFKGYSAVVQDAYPSEELASPFSGFSRSVAVYEVSPDDLTTPQDGSGYKRVDIQVTWGNAEYQSLGVSTILTDYT